MDTDIISDTCDRCGEWVADSADLHTLGLEEVCDGCLAEYENAVEEEAKQCHRDDGCGETPCVCSMTLEAAHAS